MAEKSPAEEPLLKVIEGDHGSGSATQRTVITGGPSSSSGGGGGADKSFSVLAGNGAYLQQHSHDLPPPPSHLQTTQSANSSPRVETIVEPRATVQSQSLPDFRTTSTPSISMDPNVPGPSGLPGSNSRQWTSEPGLQCGTAIQEHSPTSERASDDFPRRTRTHFTPQQLACMEDKFFENQYPDLKSREEIAKSLKLQEMQVQVWFQNRRAKLRRKERRRMVTSPYDKPASQQVPSFWPTGLPFDSTITDVGKGKSSEKSSRDIAAALQQRYPSRSQRGADGKDAISWQEAAPHHSRRQSSSEGPVYGRIITGYYPHPDYPQVESLSEDVVGILTAGDVPQGVPVIQGGQPHTSQDQCATVLIPVAGQGGHIQQVIHPQTRPLQPGESGGASFNQPPVTLYGTSMVPPHQGGGGEGYMVPVITTPPHLQQQQQRGSLHPSQQYRPPGSRGQ